VKGAGDAVGSDPVERTLWPDGDATPEGDPPAGFVEKIGATVTEVGATVKPGLRTEELVAVGTAYVGVVIVGT
jgi:hypothetical protein